MGKVSIQNIKILHKRYTYQEWTSGRTNAGTVLTLDTGELGFDLTNLVLKIGTSDGQSWAQAHEVCASTLQHLYKVNGQYTETAPADITNYFVSKVEEVHGATGTKLVYYYDEVIIPDAPEFVFVDDTTTQATKGGVVVVSDIQQDATQDHKLTETKIEVATPDQVDTKISTAVTPLQQWTENHNIEVTTDNVGQLVTGVKSVTTENGTHKIVLSTDDIFIPSANGNVTAGGTSGKVVSYVKSVTLSEDADGNHSISGEVDTVTIPTGTGTVGNDTETSTTIVTSATLNDNVLQGEQKDIVSATGSKVSVQGTDTQILIGVDLSEYATKSELSAAVNGSTHYAGTITPGATASSALSLTTLSDLTNGALYMAVNDGYIIDATNGIHDDTHTTANSQKKAIKINKGDTVLFHVGSDASHWDIITAGDDVEYRPIQVNGSEVLGLDNSSAVDFIDGNATVVVTNAGTNGVQQVKVNHADTSSVGNVTKTQRTYIDGITFDDYGHVTGVSVGTEVDQQASGGETAGVKSFISKATISKDDATGNIVLDTDTKAIEGDTVYTQVTEDANGNVIVSHINTNIGTDTTTAISPNHDGAFTVIDAVTRDANGHVTKVNTKTVTLPSIPETAFVDTKDDTDTRYEMSAQQVDSTSGQTSTSINLTPTTYDNINNTSTVGTVDTITLKVDSATSTPANGLQVTTNGDTITISGKATDQLLGLIKAFSSLTSDQASAIGNAVQSYTGNNVNRLYGVNTLPNGQAFVEVPWENTHTVASKFDGNSDVVKTTDLYAFSTDTYGHVANAHLVTVIDGNYNE